MNNKILKKILGLYGFKLIEKGLVKNQRLISINSELNINFILQRIFNKFQIENIIQIGANDGKRFDDLRPYIKSKNKFCVLIEPLKKYFDELKKNYQNEKNFHFENSAITVGNEDFEIYSVKEKYLSEYDDHIKGINSFVIKLLKNHGVKKNHIEKKKINSLSISNLIKKYNIEKLDLLYIDTEGYDGKIVYAFMKNTELKPIIIFEYIHIENKFFNKLINLLKTEKYKFFSVNENLICYPPEKDFLL